MIGRIEKGYGEISLLSGCVCVCVYEQFCRGQKRKKIRRMGLIPKTFFFFPPSLGKGNEQKERYRGQGVAQTR